MKGKWFGHSFSKTFPYYTLNLEQPEIIVKRYKIYVTNWLPYGEEKAEISQYKMKTFEAEVAFNTSDLKKKKLHIVKSWKH